jgi:hypothetical protein
MIYFDPNDFALAQKTEAEILMTQCQQNFFYTPTPPT